MARNWTTVLPAKLSCEPCEPVDQTHSAQRDALGYPAEHAEPRPHTPPRQPDTVRRGPRRAKSSSLRWLASLAAHLHTLQALLTIPRRGEISRPRSLVLSLPRMTSRAHIERVGATARRRAPEHALPELGHVAVLGRLEVVVDVAVLFRAPVRQGDVPRDSVRIGIAKMLCLDTIWEVRKDVEDVGGCGRGRGWWKRSRVEVR